MGSQEKLRAEAERAAREAANRTRMPCLVWRVGGRWYVHTWEEGPPEGARKWPEYAAAPEGAPPNEAWKRYLHDWDMARAYARVKESFKSGKNLTRRVGK